MAERKRYKQRGTVRTSKYDIDSRGHRTPKDKEINICDDERDNFIANRRDSFDSFDSYSRNRSDSFESYLGRVRAQVPEFKPLTAQERLEREQIRKKTFRKIKIIEFIFVCIYIAIVIIIGSIYGWKNILDYLLLIIIVFLGLLFVIHATLISDT